MIPVKSAPAVFRSQLRMLRRADVTIHEADVRQGAAAVAEGHDIGIAVSRNLFSALNIALTLAFVGAVYVPVRRIGEGDPVRAGRTIRLSLYATIRSPSPPSDPAQETTISPLATA